MVLMSLGNISTLKIENTDYHCINSGICKSEAIETLIWLKSGTLYKLNIKNNFWIYNFFVNCTLNEKCGKLSIRKIIKILESMYKHG